MHAFYAGVKLLVAYHDRSLSIGLRLAAGFFVERVFTVQAVLLAA
jgi:hypothetical protein